MKGVRVAIVGLALAGAAAYPAAATAKTTERQVYARSATAVLPSLNPLARLRTRDRSVLIRARTVREATVRIEFQVFCFDRSARLLRKRVTAQGKGTVTARLRVPRRRGYQCSASAGVRTPTRPTPPTGNPAPIRLAVAIYAQR